MARQVTPTYDRNNARLYVGDCAEVMATLPAESVDAIVTSPPYAMQRKSTYGGIPEADYPAWAVAWMAEARRILKPDGSVIINIRPHIKNGQISDYTLRTRLALREDGWTELEELIWHKSSAPPAGSPSRPRRSWESLHWFGKHGRAWCNPKAAGQEMKPPTNKDGLWGTKLRSMANRHDWSHGYDDTSTKKVAGVARVTDVATIGLGRKPEWERLNCPHPATFPPTLAEWCGKLITPPGGTILDPFNGSASTGVAALRNGWHYIGIDAVPEYIEMSARRLDHEAEKAAA